MRKCLIQAWIGSIRNSVLMLQKSLSLSVFVLLEIAVVKKFHIYPPSQGSQFH